MSIKRHDEIREAVLYPKYTSQDLDEFGALLDRHRYEVKLKDKTIHPINLDEARVDFGAMSKKFHLGVPVYAAKMEVMEVNKEGTRYKKPDKYDLFQHKYNAWALRKEKVEYARNKQLLELSEGIDYAVIDGNEKAQLLPGSDSVEEGHRDGLLDAGSDVGED